MDADEIDEMMIRLIGDASEFSEMMQDAIESVKKLEKEVGQRFDKLEKEVADSTEDMGAAQKDSIPKVEGYYVSLIQRLGEFGASLVGKMTKAILYADAIKAVVKTIWDWTKACYDNLDALGKQSDQLRMTTRMVQGLQRAGNKLGVDFNSITGSIEHMQRNTANMHITGGMLNNEFARLGLNFQQISKLSPEDQLFEVVEALQGVEDFTTKSRIATKLLGDNWQEVYRLGKEGIDSAKKAMEDIDEFKLAPSRAELRMIEESNRSWNRMFLPLKGIANMLAIDLAPLFGEVGQYGTAAGKMLMDAFERFRPLLQEVFVTGKKGMDTLLEVVDWGSEVFTEFAGSIAETGDWLLDIVTKIPFPLIGFFGLATKGAGELGKQIKETGSLFETVMDGIEYALEFITDSLIVVQWSFENMGGIAVLALTKIELGVHSLIGEFEHFFTVSSVTYLTYFFENWKEILNTLGNMTQTVFSNLANNVESVWRRSQNWISEQVLRTAAYWEGTSDEVLQQQLDALHEMQETPAELKGLLDGFKNTLPEIPDIPERTLSEYEKSLVEQIKTMESDLGGSLEEYFVKRKAEAEARRKALEAEAEAETSSLEYAKDFTQPQVDFGLSSAQQTAIQLQGNPALNPQKETAMNTKRLVAMSVEQKKDREEFMREFREKGRRVDNIFVLDD